MPAPDRPTRSEDAVAYHGSRARRASVVTEHGWTAYEAKARGLPLLVAMVRGEWLCLRRSELLHRCSDRWRDCFEETTLGTCCCLASLELLHCLSWVSSPLHHPCCPDASACHERNWHSPREQLEADEQAKLVEMAIELSCRRRVARVRSSSGRPPQGECLALFENRVGKLGPSSHAIRAVICRTSGSPAGLFSCQSTAAFQLLGSLSLYSVGGGAAPRASVSSPHR